MTCKKCEVIGGKYSSNFIFIKCNDIFLDKLLDVIVYSFGFVIITKNYNLSFKLKEKIMIENKRPGKCTSHKIVLKSPKTVT